MAPRKKQTSADAPAPSEPQAVAVKSACIKCRFYKNVGGWRGPACENPQSPKFKQYMGETMSCDMYSPTVVRVVAPRVVGAIGPVTDEAEDGLYDPAIPSNIQDVLDRETESVSVDHTEGTPEDVSGE